MNYLLLIANECNRLVLSQRFWDSLKIASAAVFHGLFNNLIIRSRFLLRDS